MASPLLYDMFASLGVQRGAIYIVSENCLAILEEILQNLIAEDCGLRTYRRAIGFGENIRKDLIPLLIHVKNSTKAKDATKIIDATVKILLNLTIPVECLLSLEQESGTDVGRHMIFELNHLLINSKRAFTDSRSTKAVVDHIKYVVEKESTLNVEQCDSINNCLLLLRNILHVPEKRTSISSCPLAHMSMQNQILWNLFTQSIDKIMIYLMSCQQKTYWSVTMVQLIALIYKDQHMGTLQKLLSLWFEATLSDSSDDNESNTSPQNQGSGESSPTMTSDPTSDSSDNGGSGNVAEERNKSSVHDTLTHRGSVDNVCNIAAEVVRAVQSRDKTLVGIQRGKSTETDDSLNSGGRSQSIDSGICISEDFHDNPESGSGSIKQEVKAPMKHGLKSEFSDCGYSTQVENRGESISTSSNDDDQPDQKPVHQKPFQKNRFGGSKKMRATATTVLENKELRRKKLVKRSKTNIINMKGLMHYTPTDEDILNVLKEFTVDFLLKVYGTLVHDLHNQLLSNIRLPIDTAHFFWLVTYFLKFAAQLELDLELISPVLSYDIISYLVFQGVWLYEELEIGCRLTEASTVLKPSLRRLNLVVTAIKEFLVSLETYEKMAHLSDEDRGNLTNLQLQISEMEELKNLFLLLLHQYNPSLQNKQYLQDVIVTNHNYLLLLDKLSRNRNVKVNTMEHLKEFATVEIMRQYGVVLEEFQDNGEYVNNCILTMMHHTAGDLANITTLFQPSILKTFSAIWETDYELCDDWSDLIEYVIHRFINVSKTNHQIYSPLTPPSPVINGNSSTTGVASQISVENEWPQEERHLYLTQDDNISDAMRNCDEVNETAKENHQPNTADQNGLSVCAIRSESPMVQDHESSVKGDIKVLREHLLKEKKQNLILWLQKALIEACYAKLVVTNPEMLHAKKNTVPPTAYYFTLLNLPIPLVPWTSEQCKIIKHQPFVLLLHKFGFILPGDVGKVFIRIPNFWSADYLFHVAEQLGPVDTEKLKLDLHLLLRNDKTVINSQCNATGFINNCTFLTMAIQQTPPVVRYTPHPNSLEWFSTVLQSKVTPLSFWNTLNTNQLSISIPEIQIVSCGIPPPELAVVREPSKVHDSLQMECSMFSGAGPCGTTSAASGLTRMCISDEEDKVLVMETKPS